MILHCSRVLAERLFEVSAAPLEETSPLGNWHGHLFTIDWYVPRGAGQDGLLGLIFNQSQNEFGSAHSCGGAPKACANPFWPGRAMQASLAASSEKP